MFVIVIINVKHIFIESITLFVTENVEICFGNLRNMVYFKNSAINS